MVRWMCFVQVSIHNPRPTPCFFGKTFGKTFGKGILHPSEQRKKKSVTPCVSKRFRYMRNFFKKICAFPKDFPKDLIKPYLSLMPMHILLVKLVIFRTCIFILIIVAIDYTLRISLQQFYALLNHRQRLTISRVALVKTC